MFAPFLKGKPMNDPEIVLIALFPVVILAAALLLPLLWSGKGLLLGVHVSPEYLASPNAVRIRRNYTAGAVLTGLCGIALAVIGLTDKKPWLWIAAEIVEIAGLLALFVIVITALRPHRAESPVREALLKGEPSHLNTAWTLSTLAATLPLAGVAAWLASRWQMLPSQFPVHWGVDGQPNGWADQTPMEVFGPLVIGAGIILLLTILGAIIPWTSTGFPGRLTYLSLTRNAIRAGAWLGALVFSAAGLLPILSNPNQIVPWLVIGGGVLAIALLGYVAIRARGIPAAMAAAQDSTDDRCWKAGVFYCNPRDPALMVPKRMGVGYTLNFAHPIAWIVLGALLILSLAVPLLLEVNLRH
jgi:uncharacterized membrane protein